MMRRLRSLKLERLTDSLSGKMILEATDVQGRSRPVEIRICWLRGLMRKGTLECAHIAGTLNPADMLTKCLSTAVFMRRRRTLGFGEIPFASRVDALVDVSFQSLLRVLSHRQCVFCGDYIAHIERGQSAEAASSVHVESQLIHAVRESSQSFSWIRESALSFARFGMDFLLVSSSPQPCRVTRWLRRVVRVIRALFTSRATCRKRLV